MSNNTVISQIDVAKAMLATVKTLDDYIALINSNDGMYQVALEMNDKLFERFSLREMSKLRSRYIDEKTERFYRVMSSRLAKKDDYQELKDRVIYRYGIRKYEIEQEKDGFMRTVVIILCVAAVIVIIVAYFIGRADGKWYGMTLCKQV